MPITLQASGNSASDKDAWEYVDSAIWDGPLIADVVFNLDKTKYTQWVLTYMFDTNPTWSGMGVRFLFDGQNEVTSVNPEPYPASGGLQNAWDTATLYTGSDFTIPNYGNENGFDFTYMWGAGNGSIWYGYGQMLISVPDTDVNYAAVRNFGGLGITGATQGSSKAYNEETTGTMKSKFSRQITAIKIMSNTAPYGLLSRKGYIILQGVKR
jgi:hypothetical protein